MAEDLRKGVRQASPDGGVTSAERGSRRSRARPPITFTVDPHNVDLPTLRDASAAELTASDFQHLIHISSAEIGCFKFAEPISCGLTPAAFAAAVYETESKCLEGNYRLAASAGYGAPERMLQSPLSSVLPPHLGYERMFQEWARRSLTGQGFDIHALDLAGRQTTYHAAIYGRIDEEKLSRIWVILRDISAFARAIKALGRTEKHYRSLLNIQEAILLRLLPDGMVEYASNHAREALDVSTLGSSHIDHILKSRVHPEDLARYNTLTSERSRGIVTPVDLEIRIRSYVGDYHEYAFRQVAHISSTGDIDYFDLLGLRNSPSQTSLPGTYALKSADKAATIHDVNNQLLVIRSQLEIALNTAPPVDASTRYHLTQALEACGLASSMTLNALGRGSMKTAGVESIKVESLLNSLLGQLRGVVPPRISLLLQSCQPHLTVHAYRPHLYQILTNLILNARDAIKDTGSIILGAEEVGGNIVITVSDTGCGMSAEAVANAFIPYRSTKGRDGGSGLGLYSVRRLAQENHGDVTISSEPNRGTIVSLILPAAGPRIGPLETPARTISSGKPLTILLADDESAVRDTLLSALSRRGYRVFATPNGASLLNELNRRARECDLVIIDDGMPSMTSAELLRAIRGITQALPIMLTSGDPSRAVALNEISGPRVFVPKPFGLNELYTHVGSLIAPERDDYV